MWINPTYPIYNWGYNSLTKWVKPPEGTHWTKATQPAPVGLDRRSPKSSRTNLLRWRSSAWKRRRPGAGGVEPVAVLAPTKRGRKTSCETSMDWKKGKILTGNHGFYHSIWGFPVNFPLNQSIEPGWWLKKMMCPVVFQVFREMHLFRLLWFTVNSFKLRKWWLWKWLKSPQRRTTC